MAPKTTTSTPIATNSASRWLTHQGSARYGVATSSGDSSRSLAGRVSTVMCTSCRSGDPAVIERVLVPVDAQPNRVRSQSLAVADLQLAVSDRPQLRDVLDVAAVGYGGREAHVQFHQKVRTDGDVERLGQMGDLQPRGDAPDSGDVDLDDARGAVLQVLPELRERIKRFPHCDRQRRAPGQVRVAGHVVGRKWLLEPLKIERFEEACPAYRLGSVHRLVGVDHEREVRSDRVAHCPEPLQVLHAGGLADLELDAAQPTLLGLHRPLDQSGLFEM